MWAVNRSCSRCNQLMLKNFITRCSKIIDKNTKISLERCSTTMTKHVQKLTCKILKNLNWNKFRIYKKPHKLILKMSKNLFTTCWKTSMTKHTQKPNRKILKNVLAKMLTNSFQWLACKHPNISQCKT